MNYLEKLLQYDDTIYDKTSYPRRIMRNLLQKDKELYRSLHLSKLEEVVDDMDDPPTMGILPQPIKLPLEIWAFLEKFIDNPNPYYHLYPVLIMEKIIRHCADLVRNVSISFAPGKTYLMPLPICYVRGQRESQTIDDRFYINVIACVLDITPKHNCITGGFILMELKVMKPTEWSTHLGALFKQVMVAETMQTITFEMAMDQAVNFKGDETQRYRNIMLGLDVSKDAFTH